MRTGISLIVAAIVVLSSPCALAAQGHTNVIKQQQDEALANYPLDLWFGKPPKPYSVIGEITPSKYQTLRKGFGSLGISTALYYLRVEAMKMGADAVINVRCQNWIGEKPTTDNGDFYDKASYLVDLTSNIICTGEVVKYK